MPISPSPFANPGGPRDTFDQVSTTSPAGGTQGRSAEINKLGSALMATQARLVADEAAMVTHINGKVGATINLTAADVGAVSTVNGKTGQTITLAPADIGADPAGAATAAQSAAIAASDPAGTAAASTAAAQAAARQTALWVEAAVNNAQDGVNGPAGLGSQLAAGIDLRFRFQWPSVLGESLGMGITPGAATYGNTTFRVVNYPTYVYLQLFSATGLLSLSSPALQSASLGNPNPGDWRTVRFTWNAASGAFVNYSSPDNGVTWTQVGAGTNPAAFTLFTDPTAIFATWGSWSGGIAWVQLYVFGGTTPLASVDFTRPWRGTTYTDPQGNAWSFRRGGGAWFNQAVPGQISQRIEFTASGSCVVPAWATWAEMDMEGGYGGGSGGGVGPSGYTGNQAGGSGGGMPMRQRFNIAVTPQASAAVTVAAGGAGGTGAPATGGAGGAGTAGGTSQVVLSGQTYKAWGGGGASGPASGGMTYGTGGLPYWPTVVGGYAGMTGAYMPGAGGALYGNVGFPSGFARGYPGSPGGPASATVGGLGAGSVVVPGSTVPYMPAQSVGGSTTGAGTSGYSGTAGPGNVGLSAGGGGGGGAPGYPAGNGGTGSPGIVWLTFYGVQ